MHKKNKRQFLERVHSQSSQSFFGITNDTNKVYELFVIALFLLLTSIEEVSAVPCTPETGECYPTIQASVGNATSGPYNFTTTAVPPDILNNASFETGWDGFKNFAGGDPSNNAGTFSISRSTDVAYQGSYSAKSTYGPNGGTEGAVAFSYDFGARSHVFTRVNFYRTGTIPTSPHKWIRFQTPGFGGVYGGLYVASSGAGGITWSFATSVPGNVGNRLEIDGVYPTADTWHSIEIEYDNANSRVRFWYDDELVTNITAQGDNTFDSNTGWLTSNGGAPNPSLLVFDDTYNANNVASGAFYYDSLSISTQPIGPSTGNSSDVTAPSISNITQTNITANTVGIYWTTNEVANSSVRYGVTTALLTGTNGSASLTTSHSANLYNLAASTVYYYNITSCDSSANCNTSGPYNFTTNATPDTTAPTLSAVQSNTTNQNATIAWTTNENANGSVKYGTTTALLTGTNNSASLTTNHTATISGLSNATLYYYNITSCDASGNCNTSGPHNFTTNATPDTTPPTVNIDTPLDNSTVNSTIDFNASATDNVAVIGVQFFINGSALGTEDTIAPYSVLVNTTAYTDGVYLFSARARDAAGNTATANSTITVDNADVTAPVRSDGQPTGTLSSATTSTTLSVTTNEAANCSFSTTVGTDYENMTPFVTSGNTLHSNSIHVSSGQTYSYYVRCQDAANNTNTDDYTISFSVAQAARSSGGGGGGGGLRRDTTATATEPLPSPERAELHFTNTTRVVDLEPQAIPIIDEVTAYKAFSVDTQGAESTTMYFTVPSEWVEQHGVTPGAIRVFYLDGDEWKQLITVVDSTAGGVVQYVVTSDHLSSFVVGFASIAPQTVPAVDMDSTEQELKFVEPEILSATPRAVSSPQRIHSSVFSVLAFIATIALSVSVFFRRQAFVRAQRTKELEPLVQYVLAARERNISDKAIVDTCLQGNWDAQSVAEALRRADQKK